MKKAILVLGLIIAGYGSLSHADENDGPSTYLIPPAGARVKPSKYTSDPWFQPFTAVGATGKPGENAYPTKHEVPIFLGPTGSNQKEKSLKNKDNESTYASDNAKASQSGTGSGTSDGIH